MLWCDSVAPLGNPVVPLVYWMLIGSSNCRPAMRSRSASSGMVAALAIIPSHSGEPRRITVSSALRSGRTSSIIAA